MSRYARKKDGNQKEIEQTLTDAGIPWIDTSRLGSGFPDLIALPFQQWHLLEVKLVGETLTPAEKVFHDRFMGAPLHIVYSGDHALFCMGVIDSYDDPIVKSKQARKGTSAPISGVPTTKTPRTPRKSTQRLTAAKEQ